MSRRFPYGDPNDPLNGGYGGAGPIGPTVPTAPPTAPPTIDLKSLIEADPIYQQVKGSLAAQGAAASAARAAAIQRALIDFGQVPDFSKLGLDPNSLGFLGTDITDETRKLAQQNTDQGLSLWARMAAADKQNVQGISNNLAARGLFHSGELGRQDTLEAQNYKQSQYDSEKQLMALIGGVINDYVNGQNQRDNDLAAAAAAAAGRVQQQPPSLPTSFTWGGQTWGSGDQQAFARWLRSHGVNYADWAASHQGAASIFGS